MRHARPRPPTMMGNGCGERGQGREPVHVTPSLAQATLKVEKTTVVDEALPTRGNAKEQPGKQRSDRPSWLDKAVLAQGKGGGGYAAMFGSSRSFQMDTTALLESLPLNLFRQHRVPSCYRTG